MSGIIDLSPKDTGSNALSELRDPFKADCCERITMWIRKPYFGGGIVFEATIEFKNGPTSGKQDLTALDFPSLVKKVESFVEGLKKQTP